MNRRSTNRIMHRDEGNEEQYEGGRAGNRRDEREYRDNDDAYRREDDDSESAKLATKLVHNELKRRGAVRDKTIIVATYLILVLYRCWNQNKKFGQQQVLIVH